MQQKKKSQDSVTVVTVTYNAGELLEETILSVIHQDYENIEYIVIDGNSTDGTVDIIKKYEDQIDYWVSEPDEGIYFAMNKAIEKATGEWIIFMNAGDTFFDMVTVEYVMEHKNNDAELLYGDFQSKETLSVRKADKVSTCHFFMPFSHQSLFVKTSIMKMEPYNTSYHLASDHDFIVRMYHNKRVFQHIDRTISVFAAGGFAHSNTLLMYVESIKILLENKVPINDIEKSWWYLELQKSLSTDKTQQIDLISKQNKQLYGLYEAIAPIRKYSFFKNPFKKYKAYKQMLNVYRGLSQQLKKTKQL